MDCWCLLRCNIYEFSPWRLSSDHCRHLQLITLHSFNLDVFLFLTRGDRSEGIVKFHLDGCLLRCSHGLTPHCLSDQSWDEPIRSSTRWIHTKFSNTCWTGARFCQVVPDVPVTRLWLEVQPGISVLFAFRCGIYVCLMSRFPLCLHVVPQVCAESEACGCEWVTDVHRSSRRVSCFKCFTFLFKGFVLIFNSGE